MEKGRKFVELVTCDILYDTPECDVCLCMFMYAYNVHTVRRDQECEELQALRGLAVCCLRSLLLSYSSISYYMLAVVDPWDRLKTRIQNSLLDDGLTLQRPNLSRVLCSVTLLQIPNENTHSSQQARLDLGVRIDTEHRGSSHSYQYLVPGVYQYRTRTTCTWYTYA